MPGDLQHVLICYGDDLGYHHGAKYQILRNYHWYRNSDICVVTDKPHLFIQYPVRVLGITPQQMSTWSLCGASHFGIKLMGLLRAINTSDQTRFSNSILLDTDMYWEKDPKGITVFLYQNSMVMYQNEGAICSSRNKSINRFKIGLRDQRVEWGELSYQLSPDSEMWGSALIGISHSQKQILTDAFDLFRSITPLVDAHTTEQFALAEVARIRKMHKHQGKSFVGNWSSTGKKNYVTPQLNQFFSATGEHDFEHHLNRWNEIKVHRPLSVFINQKVIRWRKK